MFSVCLSVALLCDRDSTPSRPVDVNVSGILFSNNQIYTTMKKQNIIAVCLLLGTFSAPAQTISTVAGNGTGGYMGDGGAATSAELSTPIGVSTDGSGNFYIADQHNNCIRKVNSSGTITTFAGLPTFGFSGDGGAATAAELYQPYRTAADGSGNVYIIDAGNNRIRKVNASGTISTFAGNGTSGATGDGGAATAAEIVAVGITTDAAGNVYIGASSCVRKVNVSTGTITTIAGNPTIAGYSGDGGPATAAEFNSATDLAFDGAGNLYICDQGAIRKINTAGTISTYAGNGTPGTTGNGGPATAATVDPTGIAIDASGDIYFAQTNEEIVRKIDAGGIISLYAGNGSMGFSGDGGAATSAEFTFPSDVALDGSGNLLIADQNNNRIRKITSTTTRIPQRYLNSNGLSVFPNPNSGTFTIHGSLNSITDGTASMIVMDMLGKVVYNKDVMTQKGILNTQVTLSGISNGIYFLKICSQNQSITYRLMIEK
jgi:Secretion system C-terminal sorting domain/NHL repeat